jgi:hypothetical protein
MSLWSTNQLFEVKLSFNEHGLLEECTTQNINRVYNNDTLMTKNRNSVENVDLETMFSKFNHVDLEKMLPIIQAEITKQTGS